jgi:hypothetical protein
MLRAGPCSLVVIVMVRPVTVNDLLDGHVTLDLECLDRLYLSGYVPNLQTGGQVVMFLRHHLGCPVPSPAMFEKLGTRFRRAVEDFARTEHIPWVRFGKDDRKVEVMRPHIERQAATGRSGVAAIGVAQEFQYVWSGSQRPSPNNIPWFAFSKTQRRVTVYYFYLWDQDFGPAFVKVCAYFPYPIKIWLNGHEWAKRQATQAQIGFTALSNGFATTTDPAALQQICDRLGSGTIGVFFERWTARLPLPLTAADREGGYWWELSMRQIETSRTIVFDAPRRARAFFEALVADNLDLGRPANVEVIFGRQIRRNTPGTFKTAIDRSVEGVTVNAFYKRSRIKQYLKDGRALRIETVVNDAYDLGCQRRLHNLDELQSKARDANRRLLDTERVGQGCVLASPAFERVAHPTVEEGQRAPALRFGDPRVQALAGALAATVHTVSGTVTNKSLRALVTQLLGQPYTSSQMSYDLRRLRLKGLLERIEGANAYRITPDGQRVAVFYTKLHNRLLVPLLAADRPPAPPEVRQALRVLDQHVKAAIDQARLPHAA